MRACHGTGGGRRSARLGVGEASESPYAVALAPLARLAERALQVLGGESLQAVTDAYARDGFRCDRAAVEALGSVIGTEREAVVQGAVRALYLPWVDRTARHFQSLVSAAGALPGAPSGLRQRRTCASCSPTACASTWPIS
ncbi:MAG: hypothetical protein IPN16_17110 [Gemmatimonadetes bacterium]|nr:hypothetical protein [Gemmatimonadota bacterium]